MSPNSTSTAGGGGGVIRIQLLEDTLTPVTARFVHRAIAEADSRKARYLIIELDTRRGVVSAMRSIIRDILASPTNVVVFVSPSGASATSAGLFLALASDVAVMAPGTSIGRAAPIQLRDLPGGAAPTRDDAGRVVMGERSLGDTVAWAGALAELRGRDIELAATTVSESRSLTATEAESEGLIDFVAVDINDLLLRLGAPNTPVHILEREWGQGTPSALANPDLAFVLLMLGVYAIAFALYSVRLSISGAVGAICLILAFVGLAILPGNAAGLTLIGIALGLLVAAAFVTRVGALVVGGVVCLSLGGITLLDSPLGFVRVSTFVVVPMAIATGALALFAIGKATKTREAHGRMEAAGAKAAS